MSEKRCGGASQEELYKRGGVPGSPPDGVTKVWARLVGDKELKGWGVPVWFRIKSWCGEDKKKG